MKKSLFKIGFLIGVVFALSGCDDGKANYEDKDLTKVFIENNKDKLKQFRSINTFWEYEFGFGNRKAKLNTIINFSIISTGPGLSRKVNDCGYAMHIDSSTVEFLEDDIVHYGKEYMYKEAEKCLNASLLLIKEEQKEKVKQEESQRAREIKLNKKFNENEVK